MHKICILKELLQSHSGGGLRGRIHRKYAYDLHFKAITAEPLWKGAEDVRVDKEIEKMRGDEGEERWKEEEDVRIKKMRKRMWGREGDRE